MHENEEIRKIICLLMISGRIFSCACNIDIHKKRIKTKI